MLYKFASAKGKDGLFHPIFKGQYEGGRTNRHPIALQPNLGSKIMSNLVGLGCAFGYIIKRISYNSFM